MGPNLPLGHTTAPYTSGMWRHSSPSVGCSDTQLRLSMWPGHLIASALFPPHGMEQFEFGMQSKGKLLRLEFCIVHPTSKSARSSTSRIQPKSKSALNILLVLLEGIAPSIWRIKCVANFATHFAMDLRRREYTLSAATINHEVRQANLFGIHVSI